MTENEHGYDPELDYTATDNPFWDCTDGAHPAWWRGEEYGAKSMIRLINRWLDQTLDEMMAGTNHTEVQALKERILQLRTLAGI
jgi:hypothetical protein